MANPTPTYPVELQNQAAADKLLEQHKITSSQISFPIAKLKVMDGNRPLNEAHLAQLRVSMAGRIEPSRAPCQLVFRLLEGSVMTAQEGRDLFETLQKKAEEKGVADDLDWIHAAFKVEISGGQHRAKILQEKGPSYAEVMWPCECYFQTVLDDKAAMFELVHGKNTHSAALPTSLSYYLRELRRVIDVAVEQHSDDPQWLANVNPDGPQFAEWVKVVETWSPLSSATDLTNTKAELVKVFVSSKALSDVLTEMSIYPAWDTAIGSYATLKTWRQNGSADITAAGMHLITPPFKLLFGTETHRLTKMVAFRLNGMAVPTNDAQFNALEKRLNGLIDDDGWVAVKAAAELHRTELTEYSRARPKFVGPAYIFGSLDFDSLTKHVFIPLAISLDSSLAKAYKVGGGGKGKLTKPTTAVLVEKLVQVKRVDVTRQDVKDAVQAFVTTIIEETDTVLGEIKGQRQNLPLQTSCLLAESVLVQGLQGLLDQLTSDTTLADLLPNATLPAPGAVRSPSPDDEVPPDGEPLTAAAKKAEVKAKKSKASAEEKAKAPAEEKAKEPAQEKAKGPAQEQAKGKQSKPAAEAEQEDQEEDSGEDVTALTVLLRAAVASLPVVDDDLKPKILNPEVIETTANMIGHAISVRVRDILVKVGMSAIPSANFDDLCEIVGGFVGTALADSDVLDRFFPDGAKAFLASIAQYEDSQLWPPSSQPDLDSSQPEPSPRNGSRSRSTSTQPGRTPSVSPVRSDSTTTPRAAKRSSSRRGAEEPTAKTPATKKSKTSKK